MTSTEPMHWLAAREPDLPPDLRARMVAALHATSAAALQDRFGEAAVDCMRMALAAGDDRAGALHLLAADALLTHGAEAAAVGGEEVLRVWASRYGADRMAEMLPEGNR